MNLLLDTCAISELRKPSPASPFLEWFDLCNERLLHLSAITLGELQYAIDRLEDGRRKNDLLAWYGELCLSYRGYVIEPTQEICELWGRLRARRQKMGKPLSMADGLIAATALSRSMAVVTRNVDDFEDLGVELINPW